MLALFRHCFNRSALHRAYIISVAEDWKKNNVKTFSDLDLYFQKQEKINIIANSIKKKLRLNRNLSTYELGFVEKWNITYGYNMDIIEIALKKTTSKYNPSFEYIDKLLTDWHERGFKTVDKIQVYLQNEKNKPVQSQESSKKLKTFPQRNYDDLNSFYSNIN